MKKNCTIKCNVFDIFNHTRDKGRKQAQLYVKEKGTLGKKTHGSIDVAVQKYYLLGIRSCLFVYFSSFVLFKMSFLDLQENFCCNLSFWHAFVDNSMFVVIIATSGKGFQSGGIPLQLSISH